MNFLPRSLETRPRIACEIRPEGVVAARAQDGSDLLEQVTSVALGGDAEVPQLRAGTAAQVAGAEVITAPISPANRAALVAGVRKALEGVAQRGRQTTLIVPDAAARVLLLDFDALPGKQAEALAVVRFRLKKLLPFDADHAAVSFQIMSSTRGIVRVLAVAMPRELLAEYESIVREAGFEPGAVLPSTLATLAGLPEGDTPHLLVNIGQLGVTTAIVRSGVLLLHRTVDLRAGESQLAERADAGAADPIEAAARIQTAELEREMLAGHSAVSELAQAVSVAVAYFEDTLHTQPDRLLSTGSVAARELETILAETGMGPNLVEEATPGQALAAGAQMMGPHGKAPLGWLSGLKGALAV